MTVSAAAANAGDESDRQYRDEWFYWGHRRRDLLVHLVVGIILLNLLSRGLSRNGVNNYSIGFVCDLPGVTPGTASAAMKGPFFGAWASGTTAQSWPKGIDYGHAGIDPEKARKLWPK